MRDSLPCLAGQLTLSGGTVMNQAQAYARHMQHKPLSNAPANFHARALRIHRVLHITYIGH
jgi:hypothetical protein